MMLKKLAVLTFVLGIVAIILITAGCSTPAAVPTTTGNLQITVTDTDNNPLAGAKVVSLIQPEGQTKLDGLITASSNTVTFSGIKIGQYQISVSQFNYQGVIINTNIVAGQTTSITAKLVKMP
jgi:hypothetical protein